MPDSVRGEVWLVDLGLAGKRRPCVVVSVALTDQDRALVTVVALTTSARGTRFEVPLTARFLRGTSADVQSVVAVALGRSLRRLGSLPSDQFDSVTAALRTWLGL